MCANGLLSPNIDEECRKKKPVSIENFVANILNRTKLGDPFVHVALFYVNKYLKIKRKQAKKMESCFVDQQQTSLPNDVSYINGKKTIYLPKSLAEKMYHSKRRHSISKSGNKIKISQQSLNYLYQQSKKNKGDEVKKNDTIVEHVGLPRNSLIKTQKDIIFAAMICSSKYLDDNSYCNSAWVKLTDKSLKEVFDLEREFLMTIDYKLYFTNEEWKEWFIWISHFKRLLENVKDDIKNKKSPSCMVTIPSQSASFGQTANRKPSYDSILPSPVDIPDRTSVFGYEKEEMKEEMNPMNCATSNNSFMPSLASVANFARRIKTPSIASQPYVMAYSNAYGAVESEQFPLYHRRPYFSEYETYGNCYPVKYQGVPAHYMKRRMSFEMIPKKVRSSRYLPYLMNESKSYLLNTIDTSLINQAQNTAIDFSEIQELAQQQNLALKEPTLPPCSYSPNNSFDLYYLSKGSSSYSTFMTPLY